MVTSGKCEFEIKFKVWFAKLLMAYVSSRSITQVMKVKGIYRHYPRYNHENDEQDSPGF